MIFIYIGIAILTVALAAYFYMKKNATPSACPDPVGMFLYFIVYKPGLKLSVAFIIVGVLWCLWRYYCYGSI